MVFLQMLLNGGSLNGTRILKPETVALMNQNHTGNIPCGVLKTAMPNLSNDVDFFPGADIRWGLGYMGVKKFNLVWVFETPDKLDAFVNSGWELGAQTSAAAKLGDKGGAFQGAMAVSPGVWVYQLTESGLALELTAKGTKYYKNDELN